MVPGMPPTTTYRQHKKGTSPLWWMLVFVAMGIFASNLAWHTWYTRLPPSSRNHFIHFAWEFYTADTAPRRPGELLVVVIANSQGYGWEVNAEETYAAMAEKLLQEKHGRCRVVNWSMSGARYHDVMIALADARRLNPSCLIISLPPSVVYPATKPADRRQTWVTHLYHRLHEPAIRAVIPESIRSEMTDGRMEMERWIGRFWPVWRLRSWPADRLAQIPALRPFLEQGHAGVWIRFPANRRPAAGGWDLQSRHAAVDVPRAEAILALATNAAPVTVWINMPFRSDVQPAVRAGWPDLASLCISNGVVPLDWSDSFPANLFLTAAHLNRDGHRRYAERLEALVP